jgi:large subunit ribosomal protein L18
MAKKNRSLARERRHIRVRKTVFGSAARPRLNVFKSLIGIYAQIIDDNDGKTLGFCIHS